VGVVVGFLTAIAGCTSGEAPGTLEAKLSDRATADMICPRSNRNISAHVKHVDVVEGNAHVVVCCSLGRANAPEVQTCVRYVCPEGTEDVQRCRTH
jgi:hypothetical protein